MPDGGYTLYVGKAKTKRKKVHSSFLLLPEGYLKDVVDFSRISDSGKDQYLCRVQAPMRKAGLLAR